MKTSRELFERSQKIAPGGVHSPVRAFKSVGGTPIFFNSASGAYLTSVEGKKFIDFCQSFGPLILGHADPEILEVIQKSVRDGWSYGACEPYSLELAEWITSRLPWVEKIRFVCSGTEAVMSALRVARAATGRSKIVKFEGCYHGHTDSLLVKAGSGLAGAAAADSAGVSPQVASDTLTLGLDDEKALEEIFQTHGKEIAALIIEPLPANYGLLIQRKEFLARCAELARKAGALLILDEVISGFRVGTGGMAEKLGMSPDLVTYGKVIGGGFPVGAYGGKSSLMKLVAPEGPVYQAGTLTANPVGMRAGLATLQKVEKEKIFSQLQNRTQEFCQSLQKIFDKKSLPFNAVHESSIFWIHRKAPNPIRAISQIPGDHKERFNDLFQKVLNQGVYLAPSAYEVGFLSFAHDQKVLDSALFAFEKALGV